MLLVNVKKRGLLIWGNIWVTMQDMHGVLQSLMLFGLSNCLIISICDEWPVFYKRTRSLPPGNASETKIVCTDLRFSYQVL